MKKTYFFILLLSVTICYSQSGAPSSPYYNGFNWNQTGTTLKDALSTKITTTHTTTLT